MESRASHSSYTMFHLPLHAAASDVCPSVLWPDLCSLSDCYHTVAKGGKESSYYYCPLYCLGLSVMSVSLYCLCMHICLCVCQSMAGWAGWLTLSANLSVSICLSAHLCLCLSICLSGWLAGSLYVCLYKLQNSLSVCLHISLFVCLSVCLHISLSVCLSAHLSVCLSNCLSVCLSVCLTLCLSL